jgi:tyrosyl-tRNA synthetase
MLSPYEFWQFWRNTTDADVGRFLKLYTDLPVAECDRLGALRGQEINEAKIVLANAVTTLLHGAAAARAAEATAHEPPPSSLSAPGWRNRARKRNG